MAKKKVCKDCKSFVEGGECPVCKSHNLTESWQGRITIIDAENSEIAKRLEVKKSGEYAIKVR
ncbi:DNA-directed RNA polymerase, subunit E'' [Candidatus Woesearchaeota archaeon]|nr:DNA-directed RNA polymerase, subunit E'' [Candidatus Woesearchaeota archaeon]